jgi:hypothetical protein
MECPLGEGAGLPPAFASWFTPEPGDHPGHIHGGRRQELLEGCARQPQVPAPAAINTADPWREAALHPRPQGILRCERGGLLAVARGLARLMVCLQPDGELPWGVLRGGTGPTGGARPTRGPVNPEADSRVARDVVSRPPMDASMPLGTARLLGLPSDAKGLEGIACPCPPLPPVGPKRRANHSDPLLGLGGDPEVRIDIAAVEQVDAWEATTVGSVVLDGGAHDAIWRGGWRRHHLRDEISMVGITGLGAVDLLTDPVRFALTAVARLQVVGRRDAHRGWWLFIAGAPAQRFAPRDRTAIIRLEPHPSQRFQGREFPPPE